MGLSGGVNRKLQIYMSYSPHIDYLRKTVDMTQCGYEEHSRDELNLRESTLPTST